MKRFLILYKGPATAPDASHAGWPEWFAAAGQALVDAGSALINGQSVTAAATSASALRVNGYSILQAQDIHELQPLIQRHPYLEQGEGYSIEVFELPS